MVTKPRLFNLKFYYHLYNCGVEKRDIFQAERDYQRFLDALSYYLYDQLISYAEFQNLSEKTKRIYLKSNPKGLATLRVRIISYCLMPNHFHLLVRPARKDGITLFVSDISNSHTRYFNVKNERIGNLLQGPFKSKEISSTESLLQVTRYIHLNPLFSSRTNPNGNLKDPELYPFSSYFEWMNLEGPTLVDKKEVSGWLEQTGGKESYKEFVESKISEDPKLGIEDLVLE